MSPSLRDQPRGHERLLIVDDEASLRSAVCRSLEFLGYVVDTAENGVEGVRKVSQEHYDLVVLDILMPEMGGNEAFHLMHANRPALPVLLCSGYWADTDLAALLNAGAAGFLQKPFHPVDLVKQIREILDRNRAAG